jgi:hypothetical protein
MRSQHRYTYPLVLCLLLQAATMAQSVSSFNIRSFKADAVNKNLVQLNWIVSCTTTDSAQLVVERSGDGISFQPLYTMSAITDSACQYVDKLPLFDSGYYRLVCKNGSTQPVYSTFARNNIFIFCTAE